MKQVELVAVEKFEEQEVQVPNIAEDEVLIEVETCGICGSDVHSYTGHHPFVDPPIVLGHEYAGIIKKVGNEVKDLEIGQRVTSEIVINCGECYNCRDGRYHICENGKYLGNVGWNGAMADYVVMKADKVHTLPETMSPKEGAMVEPSAVGIHAVRRSNFKVGDTALVIGAGIIGNLTAQSLKIAGARRVIVADVLEKRVQKAKEIGLKEVINTSEVNLKEWIEDSLGRENLDLIFDCVGFEETIDSAINIARKGSQIVIVGVPPLDVSVNMAYVQDRELDIIGSLQYIDKDYIRAIDFIDNGLLKVKPLITHTYNFSDYQKAFEMAISDEEAKKGRMKVLMDYN